MSNKLISVIQKLPILRKCEAGALRRIVYYGIVGVIVFFINTILLTIFIRLLGMPDLYAVMIAYIIASLCHFIINNKVTFKDSTEPFKRRLMGHFLLMMINYPIGVTVTYAVLTFVIRSAPIATLSSMLFTFIVGVFVLNRYVYKTTKKKGI